MNITQTSKALGVSQATLKLWVERPELSPCFSPGAHREGNGRDFNDDDIAVVNTVRALREGTGNNNVDWQRIGDELARGYRDTNFPAEAATVETGLTVLAQHERVATIISERDSAQARVRELEAALKDERQQRIDDKDVYMANQERLLRELADARVAAANVELEMYKSGRIKPGK
jgi:DNA-binding transcriptional MerR regulator